MIAYIVRRLLLAIPTLIGVNLIVFALFFFVNTPDHMARRHLPAKRVTPDEIDKWKREHSLDLPYFYNQGWRAVQSFSAQGEETKHDLALFGTGEYALVVQAPDNRKFDAARTLTVQCSEPERLILPPAFDAKGTAALAKTAAPNRFLFNIQEGSGKDDKPLVMNATFTVEGLKDPSPMHRVVLEYKGQLNAAEHFTRTIFYQRSVQMLFFEYGKSDDGKDIGDEMLKRIGPSMWIALPEFFLSFFLYVFFAMLVAFYRGTYLDFWGVVLCVVMMSISALFYILGGQVVLSKYLKLMPISGFDYGLFALKFIAMPIILALLMSLGGSVRFYRTIFLEEINKDYVRTARSKGLAEGRVLFVHVLKNAMIPILTGLVISLPFLFTGSLILESFFSIPGMGAYMLDAIDRTDFAIVQANVMLGSFLYIVGLVLTDISYTLVDPRVRLE